jgi:hypothetical protein
MSQRKTKEIRREEILDAALVEFAELGPFGASSGFSALRC